MGWLPDALSAGSTECIDGESVSITGEDAAHIARSLRMRTGEELTVCDGQGKDCLCRIVSVSPELVSLLVLQRTVSAAEPPLPITLYQALPKADKLELIVQKAVELGAARIVPVLTARCVSRPDAKSMAKKAERLSRIALEAAKQSGRGVIPEIGGLLGFRQALDAMSADGLGILFYEKGGEAISGAIDGARGGISFMVGSEGGFEPEEAQAASDAGLHICTMGPRILRCETAPLYALSVITNILEEKRCDN